MGFPLPEKTKTVSVTYVGKLVVIIGKEKYHHHEHSDEELKKSILSLHKKIDKLMASAAEIKAKMEAQSTALDSIGTNVTGIQGDVASLKAKIEELQTNADAAVQAALDELTPFVDGVGAKIDAIGATTAALDAETN